MTDPEQAEQADIDAVEARDRAAKRVMRERAARLREALDQQDR